MIRWLVILAALSALAGCAGHTDRTSPCVCDWKPIGALQPGEWVAA